MSCLSNCPVKCITSVRDEEGFYFPLIDQNKCLKCGICTKSCPVLSPSGIEEHRVTYYGKSKDNEILRKSTSGGVFYHIADSAIQTGGNVYGAFFDCHDATLKCKSSDDVGLEALLKSKYIENSMDDAINKIKADLDAGRKTVFCGTPCEVAGVRKTFGDNENLILVDFVCHGVPSSKLFQEHLPVAKPRGKLIGIDFRPKDMGWNSKGIMLKTKTKTKTKTTPYYLDSFYSGFITHNAFLRESCYDCAYREKHLSDITIADFWGYKNAGIKEEDTKDGLSLIVTHTLKGETLLGSLSGVLELHRIDNQYSDYAFTKRDYSKAHDLRKTFYEAYKKKGFEYAAKHTYMKDILLQKVKYKIKKLLGRL